MKSAASILGTPRRMFLAVLVVIVLVLAWNLSKEWRTGMQEHRLGGNSLMNRIFGRPMVTCLGTNDLYWFPQGTDGSGFLYLGYSGLSWQFAACTQTNLLAVTPQDATGEFVSECEAGFKIFGKDWRTNALNIQDGQILLLRNITDTQTVYALQAVEQRNGAGYFRSRKILPAPAGK